MPKGRKKHVAAIWACSACRESSVTPTPPPRPALCYALQVTMSGNHVGKTTPPDRPGITVYATVRAMTADRLPTPARRRRGQPPRPARLYPLPARWAGGA